MNNIHTNIYYDNITQHQTIKQITQTDIEEYTKQITGNLNIIGITGRKYSGKDTVGEFLVKNYNYERIAYADALKDVARDIFNFDDEQLYGSKKEEIDEYWGITPRHALQFIGTDLFRNHIGELKPQFEKDIWILVVKRKILKRLKENPNAKFVITDVRFPNELNAIKDLGGVTFKLERKNNANNDMHESEILIDALKTDFVITNNNTKEYLFDRVKSIMDSGCM
jgi:hypothetical protein